ncbi:MAG TPA: SDR family NAD(P)-dependent oxidoreductase [Gemmatimonadaceae bacterium]
MNTGDLTGRTVLITGANSGLGRASANALAARGATVVLAARSEARTQPVLDEIRRAHPAARVEFLDLDLTSLASVRGAAERVLASGRRLDVLMNNAGIAGTAGLTEDGFEITIGTNYIGHVYLTSLLLPRLLEAPQGRIVNIASVGHERVHAFDWRWLDRRTVGAKSGFNMYAASKLMNILHARELARRLAATRVTTYAVHPGGVASNIWRSLPSIVRRVLMLFLVSNEEGARTQVWCATAPELASSSGRYYYECREARGTQLSRDMALAAELYDRTERAIADALGR